MFSFLVGFVSGTAVGIYLSQNYEVPDMKKVVDTIKESAKRYEKKSDGATKNDS